jgi:DNA-binding CsgD family transcriptional regulator/tetratricopeptide (TPR) repeat protein
MDNAGMGVRLPTREAGPLLEREESLAELGSAFASAAAGDGRMLLVAGDSGVGKTALVRAAIEGAGDAARVLWGACDPLSTPAPLGPFADLAVSADAGLRALLAGPCSPHELFAALRDEIAGSPTILVVEDIHWADEATLDVLRLLGRRVARMQLLVVVTYRDEQRRGVDPLRVALGDLAGASGISRIELCPLSFAAVKTLAEGREIDPEQLHRRTGGNPFFLTEVLGEEGSSLPPTVRDAVLARASRLGDDARRTLDVVASSTRSTELWLLDELCADAGEGVAASLAAGMLVEAGGAVGFRHTIAREAIESAMPAPRRRELHGRILAALASSDLPDTARLAHHAELAGDAEATMRFAVAAAERATSVCAHREAAAQYARALQVAGDLAPVERAGLLERQSDAFYASDDQLESIASLHAAIALHQLSGDTTREADATRRLVPRLACRGQMDEARDAVQRAVMLIEPDASQREYGGVLAAMAYLDLNIEDLDGAIDWGQRALDIADGFGDVETSVEAAVTMGTAELVRDGPSSSQTLERALDRARTSNVAEQVPRALNNLGLAASIHRDHAVAERWVEEGLAYCEGNDLDLWRLSILANRARLELNQGRWTEAAETTALLLDDLRDSPGAEAECLLTLTLVRARRGDPDAPSALERSRTLMHSEPGLLVALAAAEAEAQWLGGRASKIGATTEAAYEIALEQSSPWPLAELTVWRHRARCEIRSNRQLPEPVALELDGDHKAASAVWARLGCPYESALVLSLADDPAAVTEGHGLLQQMGARPAATIAARRLRELGVRGIVRGPRRATRRNPANLTTRELDVLALVADGLSNSEIATHLFLSPRTVDHHVSAILRKLGVPTRGRAIAAASATGILSPTV